MKKHAWLILTAMMFLSACQYPSNNTEIPTEQVPTEPVVTEPVVARKSLILLTSPLLDYYQFDKLDLTDLRVSEATYDKDDNLLSSNEITDFKVINDADGNEAHDGDILSSVGYVNYSVVKEGFESASFNIFVTEVSNFAQYLILQTLPDKTAYTIGENYTDEGMVIKLNTKYVAEKSKNMTQVVKDYHIKINGVEYEEYQFTTPGSYTVEITYPRWDTGEDLKVSYSVYCIEENTITTPKQYVDNTINFQTDKTTAKIKFTNSNVTLEEGDKGYYSPEEVINEYNMEDYTLRNASNWVSTPSTGEVPLLVVPIVTPGDESKATEENWNIIQKAFFGNSSDLHFESLHSYYYQASKGKLDFTGGVTGFFTPGDYDKTFKTISNYSGSNVGTLASLCLKWAVSQYGIDPKDYDSNGDGFIDGLWMVYLHKTNGSDFWAYTSTTQKGVGNVDSPVVNIYGWAGLEFLTDSYYSLATYPEYYANHECDAHVLIHETGHMLGAQDYYAYMTGNITDYSYDPLGSADMMSQNCGDHNIYTKLLYGWATPYIVYGDCTISLPSSQLEETCIVFAKDSREYKKDENGKVLFNAYDEYIAMELYQPKNLNVQGYDCYGSSPIQGTGVKVYHVDNRLFKYTSTSYNYSLEMYDNPDDPFEDGNTDSLFTVISNTKEGLRAESNYGVSSSYNPMDEVRLISKNHRTLSSDNPATSTALFTAGSTFSVSSYNEQFINGLLDSGEACSFSASILSIL